MMNLIKKSAKKFNLERLGQVSAILASLTLPTIINISTTNASPRKPTPPSPTNSPTTRPKRVTFSITDDPPRRTPLDRDADTSGSGSLLEDPRNFGLTGPSNRSLRRILSGGPTGREGKIPILSTFNESGRYGSGDLVTDDFGRHVGISPTVQTLIQQGQESLGIDSENTPFPYRSGPHLGNPGDFIIYIMNKHENGNATPLDTVILKNIGIID